MTLQIYETIISDGHGEINPSYLCIHETANPGATAYDHIDWWSRDDTFAVHYICDWTGRIYHCVPNNRKCNQVGNGNRYVIGLEICHAENQEDFDVCWGLAVEWAAYMLEERGWGIDRLLSHNDCTRTWGGTDHTDPLDYFAEYGRSWSQFKQDVKALMEKEEDEVISEDDVARIAQASANYTWGLEKQGRSMANWIVNMPYSTTIESLGYTNKNMNGDDDVYQILTDIRRKGGWDYVNPKLEQSDVYQILRDIRDTQDKTAETLLSLSKAIEDLADKIL